MSHAVRQVRLRSLAKINLDLRVLNRRADGFHELRTVFQTISLSDVIEIAYTAGRGTGIELESEIDIPGNLILRATELVVAATKARGRIQLRLKKRIPIGGGLGGGSSNAAAILLALPVLFGKILPLSVLLELAGQLGSDVPFFLLGGTALGLGRGTELYPAPEPPARTALLVTPGLHVSTPEAFRRLGRELTDGPSSRIINSFQSFAWRLGEGGLGRDWSAVNDFESVVFSQYPQLKSIKGKLLKLGAQPALMSGSGSTVFGIFDSRERRDRAAARLRSELGTEKVHPVSIVRRSGYRAMWLRQLGAHARRTAWPPQSRYRT